MVSISQCRLVFAKQKKIDLEIWESPVPFEGDIRGGLWIKGGGGWCGCVQVFRRRKDYGTMSGWRHRTRRYESSMHDVVPCVRDVHKMVCVNFRQSASSENTKKKKPLVYRLSHRHSNAVCLCDMKMTVGACHVTLQKIWRSGNSHKFSVGNEQIPNLMCGALDEESWMAMDGWKSSFGTITRHHAYHFPGFMDQHGTDFKPNKAYFLFENQFAFSLRRVSFKETRFSFHLTTFTWQFAMLEFQ